MRLGADVKNLQWKLSAGVDRRCLRINHIRRRSTIPCLSIAGANTSSASLVDFLTREGFEAADVQRALRRNPALSQTSIEDKVGPMLKLLRSHGLQQKDLEVMLLRTPQMFTFSIDQKVLPVLGFLAELGLTEEQITEVMRRYPTIMGLGVKSHLIPHLAYLKSLGVRDEELVPLILARPQVLGASIEMIIGYLRLIRVSRANIGKLLQSYPYDYVITGLHKSDEIEVQEPKWLKLPPKDGSSGPGTEPSK
jgi:mTERF domain-containing protein